MIFRALFSFTTLTGISILLQAEPLRIDLTTQAPPPTAAPYGPGTTKSPQDSELSIDQQSFFLNGQPWIPVVGEFHYARYPQAEWRDELLKMKAGGINTVSTYVFWIHHEEEQGNWDWSGQRSLRDFIKTAQEAGLKVMVRMGPWCHGEARNGGHPDWVLKSGAKPRTKDPAYLTLVEPLFEEEAKQMKGLYWKDGGPIIGVQLENECDKADYLLGLKELAKAKGVDVPIYTITGWQGGLPKSELIPLFGGYTEGFWGGRREDYRKEFMFNEVRAMNDLGAQLEKKNASNTQLIAQFPYACAEIGGGMMSSYIRRIKIQPENIAALALAKLGSGNNMPGFYMYHGGLNPDGKLSTMQEERPNQMPVKDYDFQAPIGAEGQIRDHYFLLREQNLFLQDFGSHLARMTPYFPEKPPASVKDFKTLRWNVRSDGKSGFLFFSNQQPYEPLPEHKDVQFEVKMNGGLVTIPREPITIPTGSYGYFPVNLNCDGVTLEYATAQPISQMRVGANSVFFFSALEGIAPELALRSGGNQPEVKKVQSGTGIALSLKKTAGGSVVFIVLTPEQGRQLTRVTFAGQERALLTAAVAIPEKESLRLQSDRLNALNMAIFPPVQSVAVGGANLSGKPEGIFTRFSFNALRPPSITSVTAKPDKPAGPNATSLKYTDSAMWSDAAVYKLEIPSTAASRRLILNIDYVGDAARLYIGDRLVDDNFFNGDAFPIALWRIPAGDRAKLQLKVLPYSEGLNDRLPAEARKKVEEAKSKAAIDQIAVSTTEQLDITISPAQP